MGVDEVKAEFEERGIRCPIREMETTTATVATAAQALGVEAALIAKTLAFKLKDRSILVVTRGDAKIDNHKFKQHLHVKASMMSPDEVMETTGHPVGGVCPFGLKQKVDIYLDESLRCFEKVYPAAGSRNSCVEITPEELGRITGGQWVDVCK
jgi:Cys-tRNA(Pro) deacylase